MLKRLTFLRIAIGVPLVPGLLSTPVYAVDAEELVLYYTFDPSVD